MLFGIKTLDIFLLLVDFRTSIVGHLYFLFTQQEVRDLLQFHSVEKVSATFIVSPSSAT